MSVVVTVVYGIAMVAVVLGGKLLFVTVAMILFVGVGEWLTHHAWQRLPVVARCVELTNPKARQFRRSAIRGTAVGDVVAPLSKEPCAWYRVRVIQTIEHYEHPTTYVDLWTHQSDSALGIQDHSGTVSLSIELIETELRQLGSAKSVTKLPWKDSPKSAVARLEVLGLIPRGTYSQPRRDDIWVEETIVASRTPITAVGVPERRGDTVVLTKPRRGIAGVSTLSIEELRQRAAEENSENWSMSRVMGLAGIVLSAVGWTIYFAITNLNLLSPQ